MLGSTAESCCLLTSFRNAIKNIYFPHAYYDVSIIWMFPDVKWKYLYRVFLALNRSLMHNSQKGIKQGIYHLALLYDAYSGMVMRGSLLQNGRTTGRLGLTQLGLEEGECEQLLCCAQTHARGGTWNMERVPCLQQMLTNSGLFLFCHGLLWPETPKQFSLQGTRCQVPSQEHQVRGHTEPGCLATSHSMRAGFTVSFSREVCEGLADSPLPSHTGINPDKGTHWSRGAISWPVAVKSHSSKRGILLSWWGKDTELPADCCP